MISNNFLVERPLHREAMLQNYQIRIVFITGYRKQVNETHRKIKTSQTIHPNRTV